MNTHPVGTGPYRFVSWTAGDNILLQKNNSYWRGAPVVSPLTFKIMSDPVARLSALQANTIQVDADYPSDQALPADGRLRMVRRPPNSVGYLGFNRNHTPLDNPLVRQAIAHALNKSAVVRDHFLSDAVVATQLVPPQIWGRDPGLTDYSYDLTLAQSLLANAGYPTGFSTTLAVRDVYRWYLPDRIGTANAIKANLAQVGINVTVQVYDSGTFFAKLEAGDLDLFLLGWGADYPHPANFLNDVICASWENFGPRDDALCEAMERAEAATSFADQLAEYQWGSRRVHDTLPLIPLAHLGSIRVERKEVIGLRPTIGGWDNYATAAYAEAWLYLPLIRR